MDTGNVATLYSDNCMNFALFFLCRKYNSMLFSQKLHTLRIWKHQIKHSQAIIYSESSATHNWVWKNWQLYWKKYSPGNFQTFFSRSIEGNDNSEYNLLEKYKLLENFEYWRNYRIFLLLWVKFFPVQWQYVSKCLWKVWIHNKNCSEKKAYFSMQFTGNLQSIFKKKCLLYCQNRKFDQTFHIQNYYYYYY
jgi:hypothetical protein